MNPISEACYYINLDHCTERRERFLELVAAVDEWPFSEPVRWPGVIEEPPDFFMVEEEYPARRGAWSCFRAHLQIYEHCILHGKNSVMIFEDDVDFPPDFGSKSSEFYELANARYPDWGQLYFGGNQHFLPRYFDGELIESGGMCGGWAYMTRGVALSHVYELFARRPDALRDGNLHMDVVWCTLQHLGMVQAISPRWNLAGHRPGVSVRDNRMEWKQTEYFDRTDEELRHGDEQK